MRRKLRVLFYLLLFSVFLISANWVLQVYRNPAILVGLLAGNNYKSSRSTWQVYQHLFKRHSTSIMTPRFLAGLAQAESAGNPLILPKWKWRLTTDITRLYAPASTAAGLYQYTKPTFEDAKRFCIHNHQVALKKPFPDLSGCWFNGLYSRFWPSHAIEMTSARLHYYINRILKKNGLEKTSLRRKHQLAAIIHLCGVSKGEQFARTGFNFDRLPKCGSHGTQNYFRRIERAMSKMKSFPQSLLQQIF
ncbi:MAG: lytic transglycosylase domain-containing protein [Proteobacteria bacterium]|nr:lytic transglycosylase domain-containing protein [Pseudomonadota bacterium]